MTNDQSRQIDKRNMRLFNYFTMNTRVQLWSFLSTLFFTHSNKCRTRCENVKLLISLMKYAKALRFVEILFVSLPLGICDQTRRTIFPQTIHHVHQIITHMNYQQDTHVYTFFAYTPFSPVRPVQSTCYPSSLREDDPSRSRTLEKKKICILFFFSAFIIIYYILYNLKYKCIWLLLFMCVYPLSTFDVITFFTSGFLFGTFRNNSVFFFVLSIYTQ